MPIRDEFLPFSRPVLDDREIEEVVSTLRSGWLTTGPKTAQFEREFAAYVGAEHALAVNSCTAGLHLALVAAGIGPGDEVIVPSYTFAATANVVEHVGARPVLVDVEPDTLTIDPAGVEASRTDATRAVIAVHLAGHPADLDRLRDASDGLELVHDAAHSLPASYKNVPIGAGTETTVFSFYATKNLTTGEGGMMTGREDRIAAARIASLHGMSRDAWRRYDRGGSWYYEITMPGFKYNMTDIQSSIGLWQLRKLDDFHSRRNAIAEAYTSAFRQRAGLEVPTVRSDAESAWHLYVLRLRPDFARIGRDDFVRELAERNIGSSVHFIPLHVQPYYRDRYGYQPHDLPVSFENYQRAVSLPLDPGLSDEDVADVVTAVLDIAGANGA